MNRQTSLTNDGPVILDATCSFSKIWPKTASIRIDIRPECNPDVVMDAKDLKFPDNYFDEIYCDPPHMFRKGNNISKIKIQRRLSGRRSPDGFTRYGWWANTDEWFQFIQKTNAEFSRCLKPDGILHYKITEAGGCTKPLDLIVRMTNFFLLKDEVKPVKNGFGSGKTHLLKFKNIKEKESII